MKVRVKTKKELIKYFKENGYDCERKSGYSKDNVLFTETMFEKCGKVFETEEPYISGYHYRDLTYAVHYHKDWVVVIGEFHMTEIDV